MMGHVPVRAWGMRLRGALVRVAWPCVLAATPFYLVSRTNPALGGMRAGLPRGGLCHRVLPGTSREGARAPARSGRSAGLGVHGAWHRPRVGADSHRQDGGRIYGIFGSEWFSCFQEFELLTQPLTAMLASLCCAIVLRRSLVPGTCVLVGREDAGGGLALAGGIATGFISSYLNYEVFEVTGRIPYSAALLVASELGVLVMAMVA